MLAEAFHGVAPLEAGYNCFPYPDILARTALSRGTGICSATRQAFLAVQDSSVCYSELTNLVFFGLFHIYFIDYADFLSRLRVPVQLIVAGYRAMLSA